MEVRLNVDSRRSRWPSDFQKVTHKRHTSHAGEWIVARRLLLISAALRDAAVARVVVRAAPSIAENVGSLRGPAGIGYDTWRLAFSGVAEFIR